METVLITLLVLSNIGALVFLLYEDRMYGHRKEAGNEREIVLPDIMGKSLPVRLSTSPSPGNSHPTANSIEGTAVDIRDVTFDEQESPKSDDSFRIPKNRLDEVFTDVRITDVPTRYSDSGAEENPQPHAGGISFEDIDTAAGILKKTDASGQEKFHAGKVFHEMDGNEFYNLYLARNEEYKAKIHELVGAYLGSPKPLPPKPRPKGKPLRRTRHVPKVPDNIEDFDIRDFI